MNLYRNQGPNETFLIILIETNPSYYRARYYDPSAGGFLSEDPLQFLGGGTSFYRYSFQNPTNVSDPSGLSPSILDRILNWLKPTPTPPPPPCPKVNCDPDGYRTATPEERNQVLTEMAAYTGTPYVSGGKTPGGFDCSGVFCWAVQHTINGSFPNQSAQAGPQSLQNPQPGLLPINPQDAGSGDAVLFPTHVGINNPNSPQPGRTLLSARSSVGVNYGDPAWWPGKVQFLRLRVPCNK